MAWSGSGTGRYSGKQEGRASKYLDILTVDRVMRAPPKPTRPAWEDRCGYPGQIPGAESLRIEFDRQCSTERRHDPLTISDATGRIVAIRSGRDWTDWGDKLRVQGDELSWKFISDGSVSGWGRR